MQVWAVLREIGVMSFLIPASSDFQNQTSKDRPARSPMDRGAVFSEPLDYLSFMKRVANVAGVYAIRLVRISINLSITTEGAPFRIKTAHTYLPHEKNSSGSRCRYGRF
jgi:hypothetical protein